MNYFPIMCDFALIKLYVPVLLGWSLCGHRRGSDGKKVEKPLESQEALRQMVTARLNYS